MRAMLNWAISNDLIGTNPVTGLKAPAPNVQRDRTLDDGEIRAFWLGCDQLGWPFGPLFKLLLLTAQRRDEVAEANWSEVDLAKGLWTLPGKRTKNGKAHVVHLAPAAVEILVRLPRIGSLGLLFTTNGDRPVSGFGRARERLTAKMTEARGNSPIEDSKVAPFTLHDLRRTAATGMAAIGIAPSCCGSHPQPRRRQNLRNCGDL
jgi:integrase